MPRIHYLLLTIAVALSLTGCITTVKGPKLFDHAVLEVKTEETLVIPSNTDKDVLRLTAIRLNEFTKDYLAKGGDLMVVPECGPRTLRVIQDLMSLTLGSESEASRSFFSGAVTAKTQQKVFMATSVSIQDCQSGKILSKTHDSEEDKNPLEVMKNLAKNAAAEAYSSQFQILKRGAQ